MADKNLEYLTEHLTTSESGSGAGESPTVSHSFTESSILNFTTLSPLVTTQGSSWLSSIGLGFCENQWIPVNHIVFQIANVFFFLSYLAPPGIHGLLFMRICLMLASLFLALWGGIIICAFDTLVWNLIFTFVNFVQVGIILYILRPVRFRTELECVYAELFKPLRVSRHQFKKTVKCMREICVLKPREAFCIEKVTRADRLTLVLSGRLLVSQAGHTLHVIEKHQFVDSPEWFGVTSEEFYQTTILALEECRLLVWNRDKLRLTISDDQFLQTVLDNILGKDVVKKLLLVTETSCNGSTSTHTNVNEVEGNSETAKLLQENKMIGRELILSQQIENPNSNVWNLTNIAEDPRDTETTV